MCGIAAFSISQEDTGCLDVMCLTRNLFTAIESRGRDASGCAWVAPGDEVWWHKLPLSGRTYAKECPMLPTTTTAILHTRAATHGDPKVNANNHPHVLPGITGVHNGVVRNHAELWKMVGEKPESDCDSEAIFGLLAYGEGNRTQLLPKVKGDAAIAWLETATPTSLRLARLEGRPMAVGQTPGGSSIMASTEPLLMAACRASKVELTDVWNIPEWTYLRIQKGVIHDVIKMERPTPAYGYRLPAGQSYVRPLSHHQESVRKMRADWEERLAFDDWQRRNEQEMQGRLI
jgi:glucosamine--fructose-6-phosphate aminotransferase (isomerizing)